MEVESLGAAKRAKPVSSPSFLLAFMIIGSEFVPQPSTFLHLVCVCRNPTAKTKILSLGDIPCTVSSKVSRPIYPFGMCYYVAFVRTRHNCFPWRTWSI